MDGGAAGEAVDREWSLLQRGVAFVGMCVCVCALRSLQREAVKQTKVTVTVGVVKGAHVRRRSDLLKPKLI